jgi:hypothetical protein
LVERQATAGQATSTSNSIATSLHLPQPNDIRKMATSQPQWLFYAISSGACASLNGVFAKMTTTTQFDNWSHFFGMKEESVLVEALVRGVCIRSQPVHVSKT